MSAVSRGSYRKYTPEQKEEAIRLALEVGGRQAALKLGFPYSTLARWASESEGASSGDGPPTNDVNAVARSEAGKEGGDPPSFGVDEKHESTSKHVARRYTPSEKARALEYAAEHGVSEASKTLGISRYSIYDWRRKLARGEVVTTGPEPADEEERRDREILAQWRKHPGLGPSQIKNQLRREGIKVATNTVRRVMEDAGYLRLSNIEHLNWAA
ncbi:MAG: transposase [Bradymonadaceae bacterium]